MNLGLCFVNQDVSLPIDPASSCLLVGDVVEVETREGPGWKGGNGGAGKVSKVNMNDGSLVSYNVKYFMGGSEKSILPHHIRKPGQVAKREVEAPKPFEPEVDFILFSSLNYSHNLGLYPMTHESFYDAVSILSSEGLCCKSCCSCGGPRESSSVATQSQGAEGEIFSPEEACSSSRGRPREVLYSLCSNYSYD